MTPVPPPASPCVKIELGYTHASGNKAGSRFFLSYSGAAPSAANCNTLATDVASAWNTDLAQLISVDWSLDLVDVLDIATGSGNSGSDAPSDPGTRSGTGLTWSVATNIQYLIARRYRGGKPKMYLPPGLQSDLYNGATWQASYVTEVQTQITAFFTALEALTVGSMGTFQHVNLSYYQGFKNIANSSGRERAVPQYRTAALLDTVTGYTVHNEVSSQRRRRTATTV